MPSISGHFHMAIGFVTALENAKNWYSSKFSFEFINQFFEKFEKSVISWFVHGSFLHSAERGSIRNYGGGLNFSTTFHRSVFAQCCVAISLLIFGELTSIELSIWKQSLLLGAHLDKVLLGSLLWESNFIIQAIFDA